MRCFGQGNGPGWVQVGIEVRARLGFGLGFWFHWPHLPATQPTADACKAACPANAASAGEAEPCADVVTCHEASSATSRSPW